MLKFTTRPAFRVTQIFFDMALKIAKKGDTLYIGKGFFRTPKLKLATAYELSAITKELSFFRNNGEDFIYTLPQDITEVRTTRNDLFVLSDRHELIFRGWLFDKVDRDAVCLFLWNCGVKLTYIL